MYTIGISYEKLFYDYQTAKSKGRSEISFNLFPLTKVSNKSLASSLPTSLTALINSYKAK